jgi:2'-5' RNA ligase
MSRSPEGEPYSLIVLHDFENHPPKSAYSERPLHLTIVPSFELNRVPEVEALSIIEEACQEIGPIPIVPGEEALFGHNEDVPVTKVVDKEGMLLKLHLVLIKRLGAAGCKFLNPQYALDNYTPHITHKPAAEIPEEEFTCTSLNVIKKYPRTVPKNQRVIAQIALGEPDI